MNSNNSIDTITISLGDDITGPVQQELDFGCDMSTGFVETITLSDTYTPVTSGMTMASNTINAGGYFYNNTTNGTSSYDWLSSISADPNLQGSQLQVNGNANISGELTVQGVKLTERLDKIEQRLNILRPNEELEEKWENLRALGQAYRDLEKEIIEKQEMWAILKR